MGKLNIAHHKSYHPYRRDNIERVRRDEEAARLQQLKDEGKLMMADSEARLDVLRKRSGASRSRRDRSSELEFQQKTAEFPADPLTTPEGHINFFSTIEVSQTGTSSFELERKIKGKEAEKGVAFAPNPQDLRPWYVDAPPNVEGAMSSGDPGPSGTGSGDSLRRKLNYAREIQHHLRACLGPWRVNDRIKTSGSRRTVLRKNRRALRGLPEKPLNAHAQKHLFASS
ncbi:hypothetical protein FRC05_009012 [Tulasnella sp. 425]|nr:hypothetical protein FRC05_009012 [Tulasnella sp. 425]